MMRLDQILRRGLRDLRAAIPPAILHRAAEIWSWAKEPVLTIVLVLAATTAVARPFYVPSGSMEPTIQIGDELMASKYAYGYSRYSLPFGFGPSATHRFLERQPKRGDVVTFQLPRDPSQTWVKRVIGLPGDRIQMLAGHLWINGKELPLAPAGKGAVESEDGAMTDVPKFVETLPNGVKHLIFKWQWDGPLDNTQVYVVPENHFFMMGDNRDNSTDSRVLPQDGGVGFVPVENLIGRAEFVMGSVDYLNASSVLAWPAHMRVSRVLKNVN